MPETDILPANVPPPPASMLEAEKQRYVAQAIVDEKVALLGWESVGIDGAGRELMESFQAFAGGKMMATMDVAYGGLMKNYAEGCMRLVRLRARRAAMELAATVEGGVFDEILDTKLHKQEVELCALLLKFNDATIKTALARATIAEKMRNQDQNKKRQKLRSVRPNPEETTDATEI